MNQPCPKCNEEMDGHYGYWCPTCETPELKPAVILDFIRCLNKFCREKGYEQHKDEYNQIWTWACDDHIIYKNDSYADASLGNLCSAIDDHIYVTEYSDVKDVTYVKEFYGWLAVTYKDHLDDKILWEVSW